MSQHNSRAVIALDGVYASKCEPRFTLRVPGREPATLADYERAARVVLRDSEMIRFLVECRLSELREQEERGRALTCVAPFPFSTDD